MKKKNKEATMTFEEFSAFCDLIEEEMSKPKKKRKGKRCGSCDNCFNCAYIGEGDFICPAEEPVMVQSDWEPTEDYFYCGGSMYEDL